MPLRRRPMLVRNARDISAVDLYFSLIAFYFIVYHWRPADLVFVKLVSSRSARTPSAKVRQGGEFGYGVKPYQDYEGTPPCENGFNREMNLVAWSDSLFHWQCRVANARQNRARMHFQEHVIRNCRSCNSAGVSIGPVGIRGTRPIVTNGTRNSLVKENARPQAKLLEHAGGRVWSNKRLFRLCLRRVYLLRLGQFLDPFIRVFLECFHAIFAAEYHFLSLVGQRDGLAHVAAEFVTGGDARLERTRFHVRLGGTVWGVCACPTAPATADSPPAVPKPCDTSS